MNINVSDQELNILKHGLKELASSLDKVSGTIPEEIKDSLMGYQVQVNGLKERLEMAG